MCVCEKTLHVNHSNSLRVQSIFAFNGKQLLVRVLLLSADEASSFQKCFEKKLLYSGQYRSCYVSLLSVLMFFSLFIYLFICCCRAEPTIDAV